jgi:hypothetical protein
VERVLLIATALVGLVGCAEPAAVEEPRPLAAPAEVTADRADADSRVRVTAVGGFAVRPSELSFDIQGLQLQFETGDHPRVAQLSLPLGDVTVGKDVLPPTGLRLRDLRLSIEQPVDATMVHAQNDAIELSAQVPLRLDWSLVLEDGTAYALGPAHTAPVQLDVNLVRQGGGTVATVTARCPGTCWSLDGIASLSEGRIDLIANATVSPR